MLNTGRLWADVRIAEVPGKGKLVGNKHVKKQNSFLEKNITDSVICIIDIYNV